MLEIELTRNEWNEVAIKTNANFINIEIICSNRNEHKQRVETPISEVAGLELPTWEAVESREYHPWSSECITIDTSNKSIDTCTQELWNTIQTVAVVNK